MKFMPRSGQVALEESAVQVQVLFVSIMFFTLIQHSWTFTIKTQSDCGEQSETLGTLFAFDHTGSNWCRVMTKIDPRSVLVGQSETQSQGVACGLRSPINFNVLQLLCTSSNQIFWQILCQSGHGGSWPLRLAVSNHCHCSVQARRDSLT